MLPEQVEVWLEAIAFWDGESPRRLNAIMTTIADMLSSDEQSAQVLALALLNRCSANELTFFTRGELCLYVAWTERRDWNFAWRHADMAEGWLGSVPALDDNTKAWREAILQLKQVLLQGRPTVSATQEDSSTSREGVMGQGDPAEQRVPTAATAAEEGPSEQGPATYSMGGTFQLASRPVPGGRSLGITQLVLGPSQHQQQQAQGSDDEHMDDEEL